MKFTLFYLFLLTSGVHAKTEYSGRLYFKKILGHVHKNPSKDSSSLTTIQCGHSVKIMSSKKLQVPLMWQYVKVGDELGFIHKSMLSAERPDCFQEKYPRFYTGLNLDLTQLYYWGRLQDQYIEGESKIK